MTWEQYQKALAACGGVRTALSEEERRAWLQSWREVYAASLFAATGQWRKDGFDWHVFSFQHARARNSQHALAAYAWQTAPVVIVCPESPRLPAVRLEAVRLPVFTGLGGDLLVAPPDLSWTMAFTHEESLDIGPYFSRREWVSPRAYQSENEGLPGGPDGSGPGLSTDDPST